MTRLKKPLQSALSDVRLSSLSAVNHIHKHLTNRRQFSMVYTLIGHKMTSKKVQNSSGTTSRRRVVSLGSETTRLRLVVPLEF